MSIFFNKFSITIKNIISKIKPIHIILLLDFLLIFICIWMLLTAGSNLQLYLFKLINSDNNSIYGSVFENAVAQTNSLPQFAISALTPSENYNLFAAFLIALSSIPFKSSIQIFISTILTSVLFITATDILFLYTNNSLTAQLCFESITANIFGAPIIAAYVVFLYYVKATLLKITSISFALRNIASYITYIATSLIVLVTTYYVVCFFYRPTVVNFTVSTQSILSGDYFPNEHNKKGEIKENFSFFSKPVSLDRDFKAVGKIDKVELSTKNQIHQTIQLKFYANCANLPKNINYESNTLSLNDPSSLKIFPAGDISFAEFNDSKGMVKQNDASVNIFHVSQEKDESYNFQKVSNGELIYYPSKDGGEIFITSALLPTKNKVDKKYTIEINGVKTNIEFISKGISYSAMKKKISCEEIPTSTILNEKKYINNNLINFGVLVKITPKKDDFFYIDDNLNKENISIKGEALHTYGQHIKKDAMISTYFTSGYMKGFILRNMNKLTINNDNIEVNSFDNILVMGKDIYGNISNNDNIVIQGTSNVFYKNSIRVNKTLWEYSSDNTFILGGIGTILIGLCTWIARRITTIIRKNDKINHF
ncbi:hypothetical protein HA444_07345 [Klebsiella grimontii]|uniref:hypothetical protein n=1 Tax=Klebsiella grimontii TaxID=2058152 RepID=UPI001665A8BD|nr:hypothetical protein [Klebsiella grimontii]MBD0902430.1 hypothetical protein [Klebsiella grimontii]